MTKRQLSDAQSGAIVGGERVFSKGFGPIKNWDYGIDDASRGTDGGQLDEAGC
jgi:hypothetical protein